ncbi:MAG: branched-chain amino acid ABC transporter permease, partial [Streptosporangiaceae bacterium]
PGRSDGRRRRAGGRAAVVSTLVPAVGFGIVTASILAVAGVGFTLQFGVTNILNLAYGDTMTAAAFIAYLVTRAGVSVWLALVAGAAFGAAFSVLLNRFLYTPFVRHGTRLFGMIIVTVAVSLILQNGLLAIFGANFFSLQMARPASVHVAGMVFTTAQLAIIGIAMAAMLFVHLLLRYTKLGKAMRATAADPELARNCGIATDRVIDLAWAISGALCGLAGVILVMNVTAFTDTTGSAFLIPIVAVAVLGGIGQPYGAMLGALVIGLASELAAAIISPDYKDVVAFVILVIVLLARPQGILSEIATRKEVAA